MDPYYEEEYIPPEYSEVHKRPRAESPSVAKHEKAGHAVPYACQVACMTLLDAAQERELELRPDVSDALDSIIARPTTMENVDPLLLLSCTLSIAAGNGSAAVKVRCKEAVPLSVYATALALDVSFSLAGSAPRAVRNMDVEVCDFLNGQDNTSDFQVIGLEGLVESKSDTLLARATKLIEAKGSIDCTLVVEPQFIEEVEKEIKSLF